ncbi:protein FAM124A isoform 2-T2 [Aplochiton taeniatus]
MSTASSVSVCAADGPCTVKLLEESRRIDRHFKLPWQHMTGLSKGELSMGDLQDPFLVSVHLIAEPGQGKTLQRAADGVLAWLHPELQLFRVSERAHRPRPKRPPSSSATATSQPALAVILFLQELPGGEEQMVTLHRAFQHPPWRYHHTEKVSSGRRMLPLAPGSQDFFTLASGGPLWAVRQVHYGKEIVRFTMYCRHESYGDMVRLYKMLLQRQLAQKKEDFCFFVVYSNPDMEIQLSFKRLPRGQSPVVTESAVLEVRVRDVGVLVPLLPRPCTPISEVRWHTQDYDGNKILLQVQGASYTLPTQPAQAPSTSLRRGPSCHRNRRYQRMPSRTWGSPTSHTSVSAAGEEEEQHWAWRSQWKGDSRSTCSSPGPPPSYRTSLVPPFRLNVDALVGAEETDVDTGDKVEMSSRVDLSVVSAYIKPSLPRPVSAPPEDRGPTPSPVVCGRVIGKSATLGRPLVPRRTSSLCTKAERSRPQSTCLNLIVTSSLSDNSLSQWDSSNSINGPSNQRGCYHAGQGEEDDDQEFYI